ncbi:MAG: hypothetical protein OXC19_05955 [Bryobacterales bacterium]|nr:hypothetical protein [Bryobacterales bacterium]
MQTERFEDAPYAHPPDETDVNLRAYFDRFEDSKLNSVDLRWSDDELRQWDGNFRCDGVLMMVCCDRDVEIAEYRRVLRQFLDFRHSRRVDSAGRSPLKAVQELRTGKGAD